MKQLSLAAILLAFLACSCRREHSELPKPDTSPSTPAVVSSTPPTASFKISNAVSTTSLWEGVPLALVNDSKDGDSYFWDFGDGQTTSTEKSPTNIALFPCTSTFTISLTVKNKAGQTATYSAPYYILCSRGMNVGGSHREKTP